MAYEERTATRGSVALYDLHADEWTPVPDATVYGSHLAFDGSGGLLMRVSRPGSAGTSHERWDVGAGSVEPHEAPPPSEPPAAISHDPPGFRVEGVRVFDRGVVGGRKDRWAWCSHEYALHSAAPTDRIELEHAHCSAAAVDEQGERFALGDGATVRLFAFGSGRELGLKRSAAHVQPVDLGWSPEGRLLKVELSGSLAPVIWDVEELRALAHHEVYAEDALKDWRLAFDPSHPLGIRVGDTHYETHPDTDSTCYRSILNLRSAIIASQARLWIAPAPVSESSLGELSASDSSTCVIHPWLCRIRRDRTSSSASPTSRRGTHSSPPTTAG